MSILADEKPVERPEPAAADVAPMRFVAIRADLMPEEIIAGRRTDVLRRHVITGLAGLVAFLMLAFGVSWWQTHSANEDLDAAQAQQSSLQAQQGRYAPLVTAKAKTQSIETQLQRLMVGDLSWRRMLTTLRTAAPKGITLTTVTGTVQAGAAATANTPSPDTGYAALNQTGQAPIGTLTITGTAPDKRTVADYADALARLKGLASPYVTNVAKAEGATTFSATVLVTSAALGGRYAAKPAASTGGK